MSVEAIKNARELLLKGCRVVFSTHSKGRPGFPSGSVAPYYLNAEGQLLVLINRITQHTHSLQADPCCPMLAGECGAEDTQTVGRLTLLTEARQLAEKEVAAVTERYYRYFPEFADHHRVHGSDFWVLQPVQWRFVDGLGATHWLAVEHVLLANLFAEETERGMVEHMSKDRTATITHYVELARLSAHITAQLAGIDTEDFHLRIGQGLHWLPFPTTCGSPGAMHQALMQLTRAGRWPTAEPEQG